MATDMASIHFDVVDAVQPRLPAINPAIPEITLLAGRQEHRLDDCNQISIAQRRPGEWKKIACARTGKLQFWTNGLQILVLPADAIVKLIPA